MNASETLYVAPNPIRFTWANRIELDAAQENPELVEDLLTAGGMSCMYGPSNSGKSYFALHLSYAIAEGRPFLGKRVAPGLVVYVAGEGSSSVRQRLRAIRQQHGAGLSRLGLVGQSLTLTSGHADVDALIARMKIAAEGASAPIALIVIDTLARAMGDGDENSAREMGRLVAAGDRIRHETGAHVMYVHHSGKDPWSGARGSSALRAALDTEFEVYGDDQRKVHTLEVKKQRDLSSIGMKLSAQFRPVVLGKNQWKKDVTACVLVDTDAHAVRRRDGKEREPRSLTDHQKLVIDALESTIREHGRVPRGLDLPFYVKAVRTDEVRRRFYALATDLNSNRRADRFKRILGGFQNSGKVCGQSDWLWIPSGGSGSPTPPLSRDSVGVVGDSPSPENTQLGEMGDVGDSGVNVSPPNDKPSSRAPAPIEISSTPTREEDARASGIALPESTAGIARIQPPRKRSANPPATITKLSSGTGSDYPEIDPALLHRHNSLDQLSTAIGVGHG